ncbi:Cornifelin [Collichthys lucidus]|uniref:Cornifelin n=1 Tax=Collichthys lucidus TaxID=240159 RepID=A0A4U5UHY5_COLLU|nr:Cornifelin [Collichthys lucidus]
MAQQPSTEWSTGLCDCCQDISSCCYGFWCCPCLACTVSGSFGENRCLPLCDICSPAVFSAFGIPLFVPPALLSLRVGIRHRYNIKGSLCNDIATSCVCVWCSWCQAHRELKYRKKNAKIINVQPVKGTYQNPPPAGFVS